MIYFASFLSDLFILLVVLSDWFILLVVLSDWFLLLCGFFLIGLFY